MTTHSEPGPGRPDPGLRAIMGERRQLLNLTYRLLGSPAERVAFILHDVFGYPFAEVAQITGRTPAACRQLASHSNRSGCTTRASRWSRPSPEAVCLDRCG